MIAYFILIAGAFLAAAISGAAGFGGALLLLPLLTRTVGVAEAVPLLTIAQLAGNLARVGFGYRSIAWRPVLIFLAFALPAAALGALAFTSLPKSVAVRLIGGVILLFVILRHIGVLRLKPGVGMLAVGGAAVGFLSGLVGSAGPLGAAVFLSLGLPPTAYIASEAVTAVAMHAVKIVVYGQTLVFESGFWPLAAALSAAMVAGTWAAKRVIERLSAKAFERWVTILAGPSGSLDATLDSLKQDDGLEACVSVAWMPASALAASPRRFVRLIGMNSSRWPRGISEDRLISDHIIPTAELDPLPVGAADRRDFETILATTSGQIVMSRARRDSEGRLLGRSALLGPASEEIYIRRNAVPAHAFSETDRLMARPDEFARDSQAISATTAWRNWHRKEITPHDGLVRADHPLLQAILGRTQSASSLRLLLRSPLGFVWRYGMRLRTPESGADPLVLDALAMGDLVHMTLDLALATLEKASGLAAADEAQIAGAVQDAAVRIAVVWESERAVPPALIWRRTLDDARILTTRALTYGDEHLPDARSFGEVAFGGATPKADTASPWDSQTPVEIPATGFRIAGYIDRLDIAGDGKRALVRDYKTGRPPKDDISLDGGRELQRCLYAFAVKALLGDDVSISASLLFPRDQVDFQLGDPEATLTEITGYLQAARANLQSGQALIGPDTGGAYDDLAFALPANAGATYCKRKLPAATEAFGDAALVWEAQ